MEIPEIFYYILQIANKERVTKINELDGLWEHRVDEQWQFKVNGHSYEIDGVPPFHAIIIYDGWPAGLVSPYGGTIAAGTAVNENTLIDALKRSLEVTA